jgi:hypothetical protein
LPWPNSKENYKTSKPYTNSKHTKNKKDLKEKLEKLGSIPQVVVFVCPPPPTRTRIQ